jgi:hypothetical protein
MNHYPVQLASAADSFEKEASKLEHELNVVMKSCIESSPTKEKEEACEARVNEIFCHILNRLLPRFAHGLVPSDAWIMNTHVRFIEYQICLLACGQAPIRCLAVITRPSVDSLAIGVINPLQYHIHKLEMTKSKRKGVEVLSISKLKPGRLVTTRRGAQHIWAPSYNEKLFAKCVNGVLLINEDQRPRLVYYYKKYVDGMIRRPKDTFVRDPADIGMEQYMLDKYPTKEWKAHIDEISETESKSKAGEGGSGKKGDRGKKRTRDNGGDVRPRPAPVLTSLPAPVTPPKEEEEENDGNESDAKSVKSHLTLSSTPPRKQRRGSIATRGRGGGGGGVPVSSVPAASVYIDEESGEVTEEVAPWVDVDAFPGLEDVEQFVV